MMVRLRQPSSRMVCFSGCVLHQSMRRYRRSVTCRASWLDSRTSSVADTGPGDPREISPLRAGGRQPSGSFGLYLFGCGNALWKFWKSASVLLIGRSSRIEPTTENSSDGVVIIEADSEPENKVHVNGELLRTYYAQTFRQQTASWSDIVDKLQQSK